MNNDITFIYAPELPESVANATILNWHKKTGDKIKRDEVLIDIETDKIIIEVAAPSKGILHTILKNRGEKILSKEILGKIISENIKCNQKKTNNNHLFKKTDNQLTNEKMLSPKLRRLAKINSLIIEKTANKTIDEKNINFNKNYNKNTLYNNISLETDNNNLNRTFERVPMTSLRKCIANRLTHATNTMAMLTTFNEVNMQYIIDLKNKYGSVFEKKHQIKLGITSFFVKAIVEALKIFPKINASIDNEDIIYYKYFDVSIAMSTNRGLVTPVLKNVNFMNILDIERNIKNFKLKGDNGKLSIEELTGGNITITNGGVFGSLMSTPIINPPQTAILGLHSIKKRPMVINEKIKILPMMYLALSYDHRLIDGYEAISFLIKIKDYIEDFSRVILDV